MDTNSLIAAAALKAILEGDDARAEYLLLALPRSYRGNVTIACEDLSLMINRLGSSNG